MLARYPLFPCCFSCVHPPFRASVPRSGRSFRTSALRSSSMVDPSDHPLAANSIPHSELFNLPRNPESVAETLGVSMEEGNPAKKPRLPEKTQVLAHSRAVSPVRKKEEVAETRGVDLLDSNASQTRSSESNAGSNLSLDEKESVKSVSFLPHSVSSRHADAAWEYFRKLGSPRFHVAPMVDQSELPFRLLCRKYGAHAAYTPMYHSRLFAENAKYRKEFSTCAEDRPLFVQFCSNDPNHLLSAAKHVEPFCDYIDLNLGCPQRIARRGNYGAFLMDDLRLVESLVKHLSSNLSIPVSCKIRIFPDLGKTLEYALMLEKAGCSLLAVHGRTRDQKDGRSIRADWSVIRAVKQKVSIPVIANGNIRFLADAEQCLLETGADGVMSAESLLSNPALFSDHFLPGEDWDSEYLPFLKPADGSKEEANGNGNVPMIPDRISLMLEYLELCEKHPVPNRMVRAHVHRLLGPWFRVHTDLRDRLNKQMSPSYEWLKDLVAEMKKRNAENPSLQPLPENPRPPIPSSDEPDSSISKKIPQNHVVESSA